MFHWNVTGRRENVIFFFLFGGEGNKNERKLEKKLIEFPIGQPCFFHFLSSNGMFAIKHLCGFYFLAGKDKNQI